MYVYIYIYIYIYACVDREMVIVSHQHTLHKSKKSIMRTPQNAITSDRTWRRSALVTLERARYNIDIVVRLKLN